MADPASLRIAFVVGHFPRLSETFVLNQVTGLRDRGHQVDIYSEYGGNWAQVHPDVKRYNLRQHIYRLPPVPANYGLRSLLGLWLLLTRFHKGPLLLLRSLNPFEHGRYALGLWMLYGAVAWVDRGCPPYDIVHSQFGTQGHRAWFLQRLMPASTKLVVMFRGHDISSFVKAKGPAFYADVFQAAHACLTNCEFFRQRLIALGCAPEKIAVHYSGLDVAKFAYQPRQIGPDGVVHLVTTGRLVEKKGIEYGIRAIALLAPRYPQLRYTIIGDGPLWADLIALVHDLGLETRVRLLGWQPEQALIASLAQAHLFMAPSVTAADGNQDAPINVLKEAMAMGLPVISTIHGGIPELVQDGVSGYLVPERDAQALSDRLEQLLNEPERWPTMGLAGRAYVEQHFNLQALNTSLVARYRDLLRSADLPPQALPLEQALASQPQHLTPAAVLPRHSEQPSPMSQPQVTLVVVPRERFSCTQTSLESLYEHTQLPFNLVYVDGNSPPAVQRYLAEQSQQKQFHLIRTDYYLHPNQARNLGAAAVKTPYLVFVDNDVIVTRGWLKALVDCAEATGAAVVGPLMCQHEPVHTEIHFAGGDTHIWVDKLGRRRLREKMYSQGKTVGDLRPVLTRRETELAEFHCVLVRTSVLARLGGLDEHMLNTKEHLDFCLSVRELGETVYFEPTSLVTYVPGPPLAWSDLHYYMLRWSDAWTLASLHRLRDKWNLAEDAYFTTKYKKLGWRRKMTIIAPIIFRLTFGLYSPKLERLMMWFEHRINRYLTYRHRLTQAQAHPSSPPRSGSMPPAV